MKLFRGEAKKMGDPNLTANQRAEIAANAAEKALSNA
jgi:hypothetical protein